MRTTVTSATSERRLCVNEQARSTDGADGTLSGQSFAINISAENDNPQIEDIADQQTDEDIPTTAINFTISDAETTADELTVSATSDNPSLIPTENIVLSSTEGLCRGYINRKIR